MLMSILEFSSADSGGVKRRRRLRGAAGTALALLLAVACLGGLALAPEAARAQSTRASAAPQDFWDAIRLDDVKAMQTEMLRGASANARHPEHGPAIVVAARERSPKALAYLAQLSGTRIDATNARDETALMLVALQGDLESVKLLVKRGAEVNRPGWTPLHYAAAGGHVPVIAFLLDENAYIDAQSPNRTTPLMMAARQKHTNAVRVLIEAGADPTQRNEAGYGAAEYMEAHGEKAEAQWLRERAAEFEKRYGTIDKPRPARPDAAPPAATPPAATPPAAARPAVAPPAASPAPTVRPVAPPAAEALPPPSELAVPANPSRAEPPRVRLPGARD